MSKKPKQNEVFTEETALRALSEAVATIESDAPRLAKFAGGSPKYSVRKYSPEEARHEIKHLLGLGRKIYSSPVLAPDFPELRETFRLLQGKEGAATVIAAARQGDEISRRVVHSEIAKNIAEDIPMTGELKNYLIDLLNETTVHGAKRGRSRNANAARDGFIRLAVRWAMNMGYKRTRNREPRRGQASEPSACSVVAEILAELGLHMTEANVEQITKNVRASE